MKLAYDLRYATDHFPGIGTHARALASALLERAAVESITFLWDPRANNARFDLEPLRRHERAHWLEVGAPAMSISTAAATGRVLSRLSVDAYLSPFWLRPRGADVPCVLTLHDVIPLALPELVAWPRRLSYQWELHRTASAAAVLTSSQFSRSEILRLTDIPADRLHVVPLGVMPPCSEPVRPPGVPYRPFALTVGATRAHKGLDTLAAVWRRFSGQAPLALVGVGAQLPGRSPLTEASREVPGVHVLGHVSTPGLEWLYQNAAMVLVPSRYEGFGLPLLEAAARGVPVIASDIPALRETGEGVARFVAPQEPAAWCDAIRELAGDPPARARMGTAGRARGVEYSYALCAAGVERCIADVLMPRADAHA